MPKIQFKKGFAAIIVKKNSLLMEALLKQQIPVASSCGGEGVCTKCLIQILHGAENLNSPNSLELALREQHQIPSNFRVSCQTRILGDIAVDTPYW